MRLLTLLACLASPVLAEDICQDVDARSGWQVMPLRSGVVQSLHTTGFWTTEAGTLGHVGTNGHTDPETRGQLDAAPSRPVSDAARGALLVRFKVGDAVQSMSWARLVAYTQASGAFNMDIGQMEFRINEHDDHLADNEGQIEVCLRYAETP